MTVLSIGFKDFKSLAGENRVYYYEGFDYYDFAYLVDGNIVKTTVPKAAVPDRERFFSDKLFYGAIGLEFRIPATKDNPLMTQVLPKELSFDVEDVQDEEVKQDDIQRDAVEEVD